MRYLDIQRFMVSYWKDKLVTLPQICEIIALSQPSEDQTPNTQFVIVLSGIYFG